MNLLPQLARFEAIQVLEFESSMNLEQYDLENTDKLFQLKYLSLRGSDISHIPRQIAKLQNLLTLDISETFVEELPTELCLLKKLLHLLGNSLKLPDGIGNVRNLQALTGINISNSSASTVPELGELTSLRDLKISV